MTKENKIKFYRESTSSTYDEENKWRIIPTERIKVMRIYANKLLTSILYVFVNWVIMLQKQYFVNMSERTHLYSESSTENCCYIIEYYTISASRLIVLYKQTVNWNMKLVM